MVEFPHLHQTVLLAAIEGVFRGVSHTVFKALHTRLLPSRMTELKISNINFHCLQNKRRKPLSVSLIK